MDSVCDLGVIFGAGCSWTPRWTRTWVVLGLHLGDSNQISFGPSTRLGKPCRSPSSSCHSPYLAICILVMSSSSSPSWKKSRPQRQLYSKLILQAPWSECTWSWTRKSILTLCCKRLVLTKSSIGIDSIWVSVVLDSFSWLESCTTKGKFRFAQM